MLTLSDLITQVTENHWKEKGEPILLSHLPDLISISHPDFRSEIEPLSIGQFIRANVNSVKIIHHPQQKAKIGIIPRKENYEFPQPAEKEAPRPREKHTKGTTLSFLNLLSKLDKSSLEKVEIPTFVIAELLKLENEN